MALYPDLLIVIMLPASTHPAQVVQASRFLANTKDLATLDSHPWDADVRALARFPSVVQNMNDDLNWAIELGQTYRHQPLELMEAIQALRLRAQSSRIIQTTPEQLVTVHQTVVERSNGTQTLYVTNTVLEILPAKNEVIYVPAYNPTVVYSAQPNYVYNPKAPLIVFGTRIATGPFMANRFCDQHYEGVYYGPIGGFPWNGWHRGHPYYRPPWHYPPPGHQPPKPSTPGNKPPPTGNPPPGNQPPAGNKPPPSSHQPANPGNKPTPPRGNPPHRPGSISSIA
jgi:hypothetical protein